ncbi:DUF6270 domain-containing protein [Microbacterium esteraromaticum]|uniref:DUF6270 domain-containing protein n=1 Tax=Microbacterium esteraromaticum TaxID=57043 RepID=UPI00195EF068|nr:DUF6270 domain-containing protein [Microbacterium esteraromaticum]MBM7466755.1 hypothetical protein [Microbacterium esteraromaticum]
MQRVFIYGSCVTRDGVELWPDYGLELAGYVARQSLISAVAPSRPNDFDTSTISSPFQRRMAEGDIRGNVVAKLTSNPDDIDLILWDLTDERLGVYRVPSGGYVSRVVDYTTGIYKGRPALDTPIRIGTNEHRTLWEQALVEFLASLENSRVRDRLVLNAMPWALHDEEGASTRTTANDPEAFNAVLAEYSAIAERHGVRIARPDVQRIRGAREHQWGAAPFHYTQDSYRASLDAILQVL